MLLGAVFNGMTNEDNMLGNLYNSHASHTRTHTHHTHTHLCLKNELNLSLTSRFARAIPSRMSATRIGSEKVHGKERKRGIYREREKERETLNEMRKKCNRIYEKLVRISTR